jgi:hypothetical protein
MTPICYSLRTPLFILSRRYIEKLLHMTSVIQPSTEILRKLVLRVRRCQFSHGQRRNPAHTVHSELECLGNLMYFLGSLVFGTRSMLLTFRDVSIFRLLIYTHLRANINPQFHINHPSSIDIHISTWSKRWGSWSPYPESSSCHYCHHGDPIKDTKVVFQNIPVEGYEHVENLPYTGNPTQNASIEPFRA